jgi:hypothetical protein
MASLDKYTKEQAKEFADNEAQIQGFDIGSPHWKKAFEDYCKFATSTMSVGRNPRGKIENVEKLYPEVFSADGFAGKVARNYKSQVGQEVDLKAIQNRIMSSVSNLVKLFENGVMGTKNTTKGAKQGHIDNSDISELQLPSRLPNESDDEYEAKTKDVIRHWLIRDLITNSVLESLTPFFELTKKDVDDIMGLIQAEEATIEEIQKGKRSEFVKRLSAVIGPKIKQVSYRKLILGS